MSKLEERKIVLDQINHERENLHETIGIPLEEYDQCVQGIGNNTPLKRRMEMEGLGFSKEELMKTWEDSRSISEAIVKLWKKRGRTEISLKEFVYTAMLVRSAKPREGLEIPEIRGLLEGLISEIVAEDVVKRVKEHGDQVLVGTPHCEKWREEHGGSQGCQSELGCRKVEHILRALNVKRRYRPRSFNDFLEMEKWIKRAVDEILEAKNLKELNKIYIP